MYFLCTFQNFYAILQKFCTLIRVYPEYYPLDLNVLPLGYTSVTLRYPVYPPLPRPIMNL